MPFDSIFWDMDDDPDGNVQHCAEHGVTKEEVEEVFENATDADVSRSSGRPVIFGDTSTGKHLMDGGLRGDRRRHRVPGHGLRGPAEEVAMKRITRDRRLTPEEAARYK